MADLIQKIFHLIPCSGASQFELHRFSPMFENPAAFGIESLGAHSLYKYIFPVPSEILEEMVYRYSYRLRGDSAAISDQEFLRKAIIEWTAAYARGAELKMNQQADGSVEILDSRNLPVQVINLRASEAALYLLLDSDIPENMLPTTFAALHPGASEDLAEEGGVESALVRWDRLGIVIRDEGRVLALATRSPILENPTRGEIRVLDAAGLAPDH